MLTGIYRADFEPTLPAEPHPVLDDLAVDLVAASSSLAGLMHPMVRGGVGDLVRSMNCYYSNLIEGHNTVPRDIERALAAEYSTDNPRKRDHQREAVAHIEVQRLIDLGHDDLSSPVSTEYLTWLHREFCKRLPEDLLWVENPETGERVRVVPGEIRERGAAVGIHVPPVGPELMESLARFERAYNAPMTKLRRILAIPAAHHRMLWIHPFLDGNGRVARLMSHSMFRRLGIGSSLWSVSRGLARSVTEYKRLLMAADAPRENDYDGRESLSERALRDFCEFFLRTCIDQVMFMQSVLDPANLLPRMELYCRDEAHAGRLAAGAFAVLREAVLTGEVERGRVASLVQLQERAARNVTAQLIQRRLLVSDGHKSPLRLGFPVEAVERWFPALYPSF